MLPETCNVVIVLTEFCFCHVYSHVYIKQLKQKFCIKCFYETLRSPNNTVPSFSVLNIDK